MAFADAQTGAEILDGDGQTTVELAGTVSKGDALGYSSGWVRALATVATAVQGRLIAGEDGVAGQRIVVYCDWALIGGSRFSGATRGGAVYVAEGTASGQYTQTAPTTTGDANKIVGYALSPTILQIAPSYVIDSVA
jgi:hypothetical protein